MRGMTGSPGVHEFTNSYLAPLPPAVDRISARYVTQHLGFVGAVEQSNHSPRAIEAEAMTTVTAPVDAAPP